MQGVLNNAAHMPVFGALAIVLALLLRATTRWAAAWRDLAAFAMALAAGGAVELVQPALGRAAEWRDLHADALGAFAGVGLLRFLASPGSAQAARRAWLAGAVVAVTAVLWPVADLAWAYTQRAWRFPVLYSPSDGMDHRFLHVRGAEYALAPLPARFAPAGDTMALELRITGGNWPGITFAAPEPDWSEHERLVLELVNPEPQPLALTLRVHDRDHDNRPADRFNRRLVLAPEAQSRFAIALEDIASAPKDRRLDLSRVAGVILYLPRGEADHGRRFYLVGVGLE